MPALLLREADVLRLIDMPTAIEVVEESFRQLTMGQAENVPRVRAGATGVVLHTMSAGANYLGVVGWKAYSTTRSAARFHVGLYEQSEGRLVALIEADHLGRLRTGATTGVAVRYLTAPETNEVGLFGVGKQARTQLAAVCAVRPIRRARVYSRRPETRQAFCTEMAAQLKIEIEPVEKPEDAVRGLPLVITATNSSTPVFKGADATDGAIICAMGSNWMNKAEIDDTVVRRAGTVICDSVDACRNEAGDFKSALAAKVFDWDQAVELAGVVAGEVSVEHDPSRLMIFKSVGMAIEDIAIGARALQLAKAQGIGETLPL